MKIVKNDLPSISKYYQEYNIKTCYIEFNYDNFYYYPNHNLNLYYKRTSKFLKRLDYMTGNLANLR